MQPQLTAAQRDHLARFHAEQVVDVHCHCLPGLDDGPADLAASIALCRALADDGVTTAIATPHQFGRYESRNPGAVIRRAVAALRAALAKEGIPLAVEAGADVRVDERIPRMIRTGEVPTLADAGTHLLLELPHDSYIEPLPLIRALGAPGIQVIVSHPERYPAVTRRLRLVYPWLDHGAVLQVTAASLLGEFGADAERAGWLLLESGLVALVATDAHGASSRPPRFSQAAARIARRLGHAMARRVCVENPLRVLRGMECLSAEECLSVGSAL